MSQRSQPFLCFFFFPQVLFDLIPSSPVPMFSPCWCPIEYFSQRLYVYTRNFIQNRTATCRRVDLISPFKGFSLWDINRVKFPWYPSVECNLFCAWCLVFCFLFPSTTISQMFWVHILSSPDFLIYAVPADVYYFVHSFAVLNKSIFKKKWKHLETIWNLEESRVICSYPRLLSKKCSCQAIVLLSHPHKCSVLAFLFLVPKPL